MEVKEINERLEMLNKNIENCQRLISMHANMNHPNRIRLVEIYESNLILFYEEKRNLEAKIK